MRDVIQRLGLVVAVVGLVAGVAPRRAWSESFTFEVRAPDDAPVVAVTVDETQDPKGVHYGITTTLGAGAAARTFQVGLTRKGSQWMFESANGIKGGPLKKVGGAFAKAGSAAGKRYKGLAKLAPTPEERASLTARGKALQAELKGEGKTLVANLNAQPTFVLQDVAIAQMAFALRYYDVMYATLDAVQALGPKDKRGLNARVGAALDVLYPRGNAGQCTVTGPPDAPVYRMNSDDCPPDDFVPLASTLSRECYGKRGLYQDQDFKCSAGAPQGTLLAIGPFTIPVSVDFRQCCLEHDRDFFCGGVSASGVPTGGAAGSRSAWNKANDDLVSCISKSIQNGYEAIGLWPNWLFIAGWEFYFSFAGNALIWTDSTLVGDAWSNGYNDPHILDRRLDTCLCGGDQPIALCENHCLVNDCSQPLPALIDKGAFENRCDDETCIWSCVEEYENGVLTKRYPRKRLFDENGHVVDTGTAYDFSSCTPDYAMTCDCDPFQRPTPPAESQCLIPGGFFDASALPTAQNVNQVNP